MDIAERASNNFYSGYNCAQSVFSALAEELGLPRETALHISAGFGGGMGGLREKCGAVTGMFMAAGLKYGNYDPSDREAKAELYNLIKELDKAFKEKFGTCICKELLEKSECAALPLPSLRSEQYYKERPCAVFVEEAARIAEKILLK
ncbi:MAG: C-GCAxxG-C-C family protein [Bacillota bacterium]|nr:C-GCAxxG-C-C family protein [Bacillota bacterium]